MPEDQNTIASRDHPNEKLFEFLDHPATISMYIKHLWENLFILDGKAFITLLNKETNQ